MPVRPSSRRTLSATAALLAVAALAPSRALAQLELSTGAGLLVPTRGLLETSVADGTDTTVVTWRHQPAAAASLQLTFWLSGGLAIEAAVLYSQSRLERLTRESDPNAGRVQPPVIGPLDSLFPAGPTLPTAQLLSAVQNATLLIGAARARVRLRLSDGAFLHLLTGLGFMSRGGDAYTDVTDTSDLAFVVGAGLAIDLAPYVALRVDLEDYMTSAGAESLFTPPPDRERAGQPTPRVLYVRDRFQHDLAIALALSMRAAGL